MLLECFNHFSIASISPLDTVTAMNSAKPALLYLALHAPSVLPRLLNRRSNDLGISMLPFIFESRIIYQLRAFLKNCS
jgi:hypothetical protein